MNKDSFLRLLTVDAMLNHIYEQLAIVANDENDGRFRNFVTQTYGLKQDLEDKLREDMVDGPLQIASAPNIPNQNNVTPPPQANVPIPPVNNGNNNAMNGNQNNNPMGCANPINQGSNQIPSNVNQFFNDLLAGKAGNNQDLNDLLNQMNQTPASQTSTNVAPF